MSQQALSLVPTTATTLSASWNSLSPELIRKIASFAHPNDAAASLKLLNSETAAALRDSYKALTLGLPKRDWSEPHRAVQPWPGQLFAAHWGQPQPWRALTLPQRERLLCLAASSGHAPSLDAALVQCGCAIKPDVLTAAAAAGNVAGCERLLAEGCSCSEACFAAAAEAGHLPVLKVLLEAVCSSRLKPESVTAAAMGACRGGRLDLVSWLQQEHGYSPRQLDLLRLAAVSGQAAVFEALLPLCPQLAPAAGLELEPEPEQPSSEGCAPGSGRQLSEQQVDEASWREEQRQRQVRWDVLQALVQGCPLQVVQRHYARLWRWRWRWHHHAASAPLHAAPAAAAVAAGAGGAAAAAAARVVEMEGEFAVEDGHRDLALARLVGAAIASPTPCWAAKLDFLLSAWGPAVAAQVLRGDRGQRDAWASAVGLQPEVPDLLPRLQRLRSLGAVFDAGTAALLARSGQVDALAWLWDECGVAPCDVDLGGRPLTQIFATRGRAETRLALLQLLKDRGAAVYEAVHVVSEAAHLPSEPALCWLAEQVPAAPPPEHGGYSSFDNDCWSRAFAAAARKGASLPTLQLLRRRGASTHLAMAAAGGSVEVMEWVASERVAETDGRQLLPLHRTDVRVVTDCGNAATLEWLWRRGLVRAAKLPSLMHVCRELAPHRFWRLQLWMRAQLPAASCEAAAASERSLQCAGAAATAAASVAASAAKEVAALWTAVREELEHAAHERVLMREEDDGDSTRPARYEDQLMLPHQLAWFEREGCQRAVGALAVEG